MSRSDKAALVWGLFCCAAALGLGAVLVKLALEVQPPPVVPFIGAAE